MFKWLPLILFFVMGCKINFEVDPKPKVNPDAINIIKPELDNVVRVIRKDDEVDSGLFSSPLANLAMRCNKSEIRKGSSEIDGTLNELVADGVSPNYASRVREAVPAIGKRPARDLTPEEIETLRKVK